MAIFTEYLLYHLAVFIAWLGGLAFAASLLYLVYFYVVTLASTAGDPQEAPKHIAVNIALFSVFALHHSLLARPSVKRVVTHLFPDRYERSLYVWVASILAVTMCLLWQPIAGLVYRVDGWWRMALWLVQVFGLVLALLAARAIRALELAGIDQAAGRPQVGDLKIVGPFRAVRHPIYLGWILMVFAIPTMTANRLLFAVVSSLYLILAIPWEEKSLVGVHGDRYREYQRQVRWRVLPGIW
jgi:protein-S-isoprenylcysteine O-methyltransferase Ste14